MIAEGTTYFESPEGPPIQSTNSETSQRGGSGPEHAEVILNTMLN